MIYEIRCWAALGLVALTTFLIPAENRSALKRAGELAKALGD